MTNNDLKSTIVWQLSLVDTFLFLGGDKEKALKMVSSICDDFGTECVLNVLNVLNKETHPDLLNILN